MEPQILTAEDLLSGTKTIIDVDLPEELLPEMGANKKSVQGKVRLRPLSIGTFNLVLRAAKNDNGLIPLLMIKESLVEPKLSLDQIRNLQLGLTEFLVTKIRIISGLNEKKKHLN